MVELRPSGALELTNYDCSGADVSGVAIEYLFELARLDPRVQLRDVFLLLQNNPELLPIFRCYHAEELLGEAFSGKAPAVPAYGPENIEYLELWRECRFDIDTKKYWEMDRLNLAGVGFALKEPWITDSEMCAAGERRRWNICFMSPFELLNYPLRFDSHAEVWASGANHLLRPTDTVDYGLPTLGQIIHGVLWELTFFGIGDVREAKHNELEFMDESDFTESSHLLQ